MTRSFISLSFCLFLILGCSPEDQPSNSATWSEAEQLERDLKMYEQVWFEFLNNGDTLAVNAEHFTEDVTIITDQGNIEGIEGVRQFYKNYLDGFSDIEFTIVDALWARRENCQTLEF